MTYRRFAKQVSSKFAQGAAREVQRDLAENHARPVAVSYLQRLSEAIGTVVQAKEADWELKQARSRNFINRSTRLLVRWARA